MNVAEALCREYERVLKLRWPSGLSGDERVWMAVYDPADERKVRARLKQFELSTKEAGKQWRAVSLEQLFAEWMATNRHREQLFANPAAMPGALTAFRHYLTTKVSAALGEADERTVVVLLGVGSLFGLWSVSELISTVSGRIPGILLVFFPGRHEGMTYRLMDARTSWNYLALAIEPKVGDS